MSYITLINIMLFHGQDITLLIYQVTATLLVIAARKKYANEYINPTIMSHVNRELQIGKQWNNICKKQ